MRLMVNAVGLLQISLLYNYWRTAEVTFYNAYTCQGADAVYREAEIPPVKQTEFGWFHLNLKEMMQWQMHESQLMQSRKFVLEQDLQYQIISELDVI